MSDLARGFRDFFVSLKLTIVLLALSILLIFAATLDQVNLGIWAVQQKYFHSLFVLWRVGDIPIPVFPGGYLIGGLLMINLVWAQLTRFKFSAKKSGIWLTHVGLIVLLVGELFTGLWQEEFSLRLSEGETKNYSESYRLNELAITDVTDPANDDVVAIPESLLARGQSIQHAKLPFRVVPKIYYPNAQVLRREESAAAMPAPIATAGIGQRFDASPLPMTYKQDLRNLPAAYVELVGAEGTLGTWLVSTEFQPMPPQRFDYGGRTWKLSFRFERAYKPYSLTLLKFSHDRYAGTEIPKNYSSRIRLTNEAAHEDREVLIYMNNPLRYGGLTFYQSGFDGPTTTILQVVRNPSWTLPYIACTLMTLGLLIQFCIHLVGFIGKRRRLGTAQPATT